MNHQFQINTHSLIIFRKLNVSLPIMDNEQIQEQAAIEAELNY